MAISAMSDLVLDVVKAAEPEAVQAARARLAAIADKNSPARFNVAGNAAPASASSNRPDPTPEAFMRFEAMVLQSFFQSMLPKDTGSVYGGGMAGEMWQSLMAEQLGEVVARRGGIGIASTILRDHYTTGDATLPLQGVSGDPDRPARDEQHLLSTALIHEIQRRAAGALGGQKAEQDT